jgi:hypothetical protein
MQINNTNKQRNIFKKYTPPPIIKTKIPEIIINNECFPELSKTKAVDTQSNMDFMVKLNKKVEIIENDNGLKQGYITIQYDNKHNIVVKQSSRQPVDNKIQHRVETISFKSIINNWDNYYTLYNEIYGEDIYEKTYLFPNYNYNYFDMLDDQYYIDIDVTESQNEYDEYFEDEYYDV